MKQNNIIRILAASSFMFSCCFLKASDEKKVASWWQTIGGEYATNLISKAIVGTGGYAKTLAGATAGAIATPVAATVQVAYTSAGNVLKPIGAVGDWALQKTIEAMAERFAAAGAGEISKSLLEGKSSSDVLMGIAIGAAFYFTLMKGYGAVATSMSKDYDALIKSLAQLQDAKGFEARAPHVKLVITHLWIVMEDVLEMFAAIEKPLSQASSLKLVGTNEPLVPEAYVNALRTITVSYAAYLRAILEMLGMVVPDLFEYFGDLEKISTILQKK